MITRTRLEAELRQLRGSLKDLTGNLDRLRSQLRDIELQAETQMQSRLAQSKDTGAGFDPLEFDRFTRVQELTRMHRDDFSKRGLSGAGQQTQLSFDVNDAHIIILDDVLYTGRTIRAVINELFDYGRPANVKLAVLVDRGGRELPIQADYAAARVALPASQALALARGDAGQFSFQVEEART